MKALFFSEWELEHHSSNGWEYVELATPGTASLLQNSLLHESKPFND